MNFLRNLYGKKEKFRERKIDKIVELDIGVNPYDYKNRLKGEVKHRFDRKYIKISTHIGKGFSLLGKLVKEVDNEIDVATSHIMVKCVVRITYIIPRVKNVFLASIIDINPEGLSMISRGCICIFIPVKELPNMSMRRDGALITHSDGSKELIKQNDSIFIEITTVEDEGETVLGRPYRAIYGDHRDHKVPKDRKTYLNRSKNK